MVRHHLTHCGLFCSKDSRLPEQLQRAMAAEAEAAREARAKIIRAHGEEKATQALKQAADELAHNPNAIQLRYLQVIDIFVSTAPAHRLVPPAFQTFPSFADFEQYWQREKHHHYLSSPRGHDLPFCWSQWPKAIVEIVSRFLLFATAAPAPVISIIEKNFFHSPHPSCF